MKTIEVSLVSFYPVLQQMATAYQLRLVTDRDIKNAFEAYTQIAIYYN